MSRARRHFCRAASSVLLLSLIACEARIPAPSPFPADGPRLLLLIVVDQMSEDYLVRFRPVLDGGLAYLLDHGVVFTDAHHDHANTVTGAGHATLATGCFPRNSGIISNQWYDRAAGEQVYCVQGERYSRSPANLLVSTIGDWIKEMDPEAKVYAASGKDRSAILLGGREADTALWYSGGEWVTSGYYDEPVWLDEFNDGGWLERYFGTLWQPLPVPQETLEALDIEMMDEGIYQRDFPYALGGKSLVPDSAFYGSILSSPYADMYLAELARTIIEREGLGGDAHLDLLGIGFSALDYVGHEFGPNSREVLDTIMRLDRAMGELFAFIDDEIGLENTVIGLSADHGVAPLPAYRLERGEWAKRADMRDVACFQQVGRALQQRYGDTDWLAYGLYLNDEAIEAKAIDREVIEREVAGLLEQCDGVQHVWTRSELTATEPGIPEGDAESRYRQLIANSFHPDRSPDFQVQYAPYYLDRMSRGTTHGSPYRYDAWVPFVVAGPGIDPRRIDARVRTTDFAPTLAGLLGISMPAGIDGTDRSDALRSR